MWSARLLYTGTDLQEAIDKAQQDIDKINENLSNAVGRPISLQSIPDINTALPVIEDNVAYCNIVKPLDIWIQNFNAMDGVDNFYTEAEYTLDWKLPPEPEE